MADVPFSVLMKQAAALKTSQLAVDRTKFDSWDCWYQHSLFAKEVRIYSLCVNKLFVCDNFIVIISQRTLRMRGEDRNSIR